MLKTKLIIRRFLLLALTLPVITNAHSQVLKRKNIDLLTQTELAAYEHAIQILNDRSALDPYNKEGYAWQAWVHNNSYVLIPPVPPKPKTPEQPYTTYYMAALKNSQTGSTPGYPGECEHGKDLFLFWHRAEFYYFERLLQDTDPAGTITDSKGNKGPATANVTIPYWNFTAPASDSIGKRFPRAFTNKSSILYQPNRAVGNPKYRYTSKDFIQDIVNTKWLVFGGYPDGTGAGAALGGGFGRFEFEVHNYMHAEYCGGYMARNSTAAYDPIFYSFHAYLDYVFDEWIRLNGMEATGKNPDDTITSLDYHLRGDVPARYNPPGYTKSKLPRAQPSMSTCWLYLDHKNLKYEYEVADTDRYNPPTVAIASLLDKNGNTLVFGKSGLSPAAALHINTALAPKTQAGQVTTAGAPDRGNTAIRDGYFNFQTNTAGSFTIDVYIHPKSVKANVADKAFRNKYLANSAAHWALEHGNGEHNTAQANTVLNIYIARELADLAKNFKPGEWVITTNVVKS